jgi:glycosyltransferase involved in cell wall biosynthesis
MTARKKIICYDDNPDYGGHQVMACLAVEALAKSANWNPVFFCNPKNIRLTSRLRGIQTLSENLETRDAPFATQKLQGLRNRFADASITKLACLFERETPDLILCIQGEIEDGSLALCAAERIAAPCISYIPVPHRMALMGAKFGAVRDMLNEYLFKKPDGWITISESMKVLLRERGATAPVEVVPNGIDMERFVPRDKNTARAALGLPTGKTILGTIGRIEFNQKQQDFLLRTFFKHWKGDPSMHLMIVGDGPDRDRLDALIRELGAQQQVTLLPWQADSTLVYSAMDMLVIPSRFEGVPLVMLEAIACGTPVVGSARDGMKDLLPANWTFQPENGEALADTIRSVFKTWGTGFPALQAQVRNDYTVNEFQRNFESALFRLLRSPGAVSR